jgi:acyl-ACP thioesterase
MSTVPPVLREQRLVESFDVDTKARLKPHILFAYMTNCAWKHSALTTHGYKQLLDRNQMWVLTKFQLSVTRFPCWAEQIVIETWGKGIQKLYALRDFIVSTPEGEKLASATSAWIVLDKDNHRPVRIDQMSFPWTPGRNELTTDLGKLPALPEGKACGQFRAVFSDLDVNEHVTAMRYLQWIMDSHPGTVLRGKQLCSLEISFLGEAAAGDEVTIFTEDREGHELCSVRRAIDQKELCRAKIEWT